MRIFRVGIVWVGIFLGGNFPGWSYPVGIIRVAIFRVGVFLVPENSALQCIKSKTAVTQSSKSNSSEVFCKKCIPRIFSRVFSLKSCRPKVAGPRPETLLKKRLCYKLAASDLVKLKKKSTFYNTMQCLPR